MFKSSRLKQVLKIQSYKYLPSLLQLEWPLGSIVLLERYGLRAALVDVSWLQILTCLLFIPYLNILVWYLYAYQTRAPAGRPTCRCCCCCSHSSSNHCLSCFLIHGNWHSHLSWVKTHPCEGVPWCNYSSFGLTSGAELDDGGSSCQLWFQASDSGPGAIIARRCILLIRFYCL